MKKAVAAVIGLTLAAIVNVGSPPADAKSNLSSRKSQASKLSHARKQPGNSRAPLSKSSSQQDETNLVASGTTKVAFASDRDGNLEIYTMGTDGGGLARLTENNAEDFS